MKTISLIISSIFFANILLAQYKGGIWDLHSMQKPIGATLYITPTSLTNFTNVAGTPPTAQSITYTIASTTANVTIPGGFEASIDNQSTWHLSFSGLATGGTMWVRVAAATVAGSYSGNITFTATGLTAQNCAVTATVSSAAPTITVSPAALTLPSTASGTQSGSQSSQVNGSNLTANIVATASANFLVSLDGLTYTSSVTITQSGGTVSNAVLSCVLSSGAAVGSYSGRIVLTSTGATNDTITVSGTATTPSATPIDTIVAIFNFKSAAQNITGYTDAAADSLGFLNTSQQQISTKDFHFVDYTNYMPVHLDAWHQNWYGVVNFSSTTTTGGSSTNTVCANLAGQGYWFNSKTITAIPSITDTMITISNLIPGAYYRDSIFSNRSSSGNPRYTLFIFWDSSTHRIDTFSVNSLNNQNTPVICKNLVADANGKIYLSIHAATYSTSQYGYINWMALIKQPSREAYDLQLTAMLLLGLDFYKEYYDSEARYYCTGTGHYVYFLPCPE